MWDKLAIHDAVFVLAQLTSGAILLLTGSAGAGKTATIHVLANELGFEVQEWINPLSDIEGNLYPELEILNYSLLFLVRGDF